MAIKPLADIFYGKFRLIPKNERGFSEKQAMHDLRLDMHQFAELYVRHWNRGDLDPAEIFYFSDGSSLRITNPDQEAFPAMCSPMYEHQYFWWRTE